MLINVAFDGEKLFEWEGDAEAVASIDQEVIRIAKLGNVEPTVLAQSALVHIKRKGGFITSNPQDEMMMVIWLLISMPTGDPDRPGLYRDYLEMWNFDFDIKVDPDAGTFKAQVAGSLTARGAA
jgi:hypothetical protein